MPDSLLAQLRQVDVEQTATQTARVVESSYAQASEFAEQHVARIGLLIAASLLSLYGGWLTHAVRRRTVKWPFPLRAGLFIVVVGVGFASIIASLAPVITTVLELVPRYYVIPATLAAFTIVGILAEHNERI